MSRRDECLISNYEDAIAWLDEFKHTIVDEQAVKVIEHLQVNGSEEYDVLQLQNEQLADECSSLESDIEELKNEIAELKAA